MNNLETIADIPKLFTALAEWLACVVYALIILRGRKEKRTYIVLPLSLILLMLIQYLIGVLPIGVWIPGMLLAVAVMYGTVKLSCGRSREVSVYWTLRAFTFAEFAASLEWQLYFYISHDYPAARTAWFYYGFLILTYGIVFFLMWLLETKNNYSALAVNPKQLIPPVIIVFSTFILSNISYVSSQTPFSSEIGIGSFNVRTLVTLGGVAFLYAYHIQLNERQAQIEISSIRNVLKMHYQQYQQSKQTADIINHKYHDLKHQIAVLRQEPSQTKREAYLDEIESSIRAYEMDYKTGNAVVDTVLHSKALILGHEDITFTCVADGTVCDTMNVMDTCTILGNALDNAIEHEQKISDPSKRMVHLTMTKHNNFGIVSIENYTEEDISIGQTLPSTTKSDPQYHGFGLKSMKHIAQKYGGEMTISCENHWFTVTILFPLQAQKGINKN